MAGELHDNAEAKAFAPAGVESPRVQQTNQDMLDGQHLFTSGKSAASEPTSLDFGNPASLYGKDNLIAQDMRLPTMPTLVPSPEQLGITKPVVDATVEASRVIAEKAWNPYRYNINDAMSQIPEESWNQAYEAFPQFKQAGLSEKQTTELMQAIVRNELYNYNVSDKNDDAQATKNGAAPDYPFVRPAYKATLGFSQLSPVAVQERAAEYPDQMKDLAKEPIQTLLNPERAPLLVAATLAHNVEMYQRHHVPLTEESLAYSYNPPNHRVLPTSENLRRSEHVKNVMHQLAIIRHEAMPKPDER